jgi:ribonuclease Z
MCLTIVEAGHPNLVAEDWAGILVKPGTPSDVVARLNAAVNKALKTEKVRLSLGESYQGSQHQDQSMTASDFRVTLLGTGAPVPNPDRFGPCTLVEAGNQKFLIDAGRGAVIRLSQLKVPIGRINVQFLTHYHSDHTSGVPDVWVTGWLESHFGTRKTPYRVIGPRGARDLMENLERAYACDIKIRIVDEKLPPSGVATEVTEFDRDGIVYEKDGVKVIAFEVDHGDVIKPCYGYRFEYGGRTAVFSADTCHNDNVIKYGAGADLLVHEGASARPELMKEAYVQRIIGHHTRPHEAGRVFTQIKPKLAAHTHIVLLGSEHIPPPTIDDIVAETRQTYSGPLVVGEDLTVFDIGETVTVRGPGA